MRYMADLHTHTTASDGQYTPTELLQMARVRGLNVVAITDHDTTTGVSEAEQAGAALGVRVIPGVELSAREHKNFHILGYSYNPSAAALLQLCREQRTNRIRRENMILDFLSKKGYALSRDEVERFAGGAVIGRPHFAQAMVRRSYVQSKREAFDRFLDTEEFWRKIPRLEADARTCVEAIKSAGGKASLAHPYQMRLPNDELEVLIKQLADWGLDAIECWYPKYTPEQQSFYIHLTEKYHLHQTGGSDFHGEKVKPDVELAALNLELGWLE